VLGGSQPGDQLRVWELERVSGPRQDLINRANTDPRAGQLLTQFDRVTTRNAVADRERRDRRLQPRPERALSDLGGQLAGSLAPTARATQPLALMLDQPDRELRQLLDLVTRRRPNRHPQLCPPDQLNAYAESAESLITRASLKPTPGLVERCRAWQAVGADRTSSLNASSVGRAAA
jgi:hypothetical protein